MNVLTSITSTVLRRTAGAACGKPCGVFTRAASTKATQVASAAEPAVHATEAPAASVRAPETYSTPADALSGRTDDELYSMLLDGSLKAHNLEKDLGDCTRAVRMRRRFLASQLEEQGVCATPAKSLEELPMGAFPEDLFYQSIEGANCENVIGYVPIPTGTVGPLMLDGTTYTVPMSTTEGALIASTNRGCRAITQSGGAITTVTGNGMTRAPVVRMGSIAEAAALKAWVEDETNAAELKAAFDSTSRFARLQNVRVNVADRNVYLRFKAFTGDAMGMNMITKGVTQALAALAERFPSMEVLALSGNVCTDKKPSAINWVDGRGKSVACEVVIPPAVLAATLKVKDTDAVDRMVRLNMAKNMIGSAVAGSVGGYNAHASNIVTALYLATGQDPAQNVESSTCMTVMEREGDGLRVSVTMPSVEVGTVGGGTTLPAQAAALELLGLRGAHATTPGANAEQLARIVAGSVLAGELSLMAALATGDLLKAHIILNRKAGSSSTSEDAAAPGPTAHAQQVPPKQSPRGSMQQYSTAAQSPGRRYFAAACGSPATPKWFLN